MEQMLSNKYIRTSVFSIAILVVLFWGFYRTYFVFFPTFEGFAFIQHFHGFVMLVWMICLIVQPLLIQQKKYEAHRLIGRASFVIAPLLIVSIYLLSRMVYHRATSSSLPMPDVIAEMALSVPRLLAFAILYALAIINKRNTFNHMRYMIGTALLMIGPGLGRGLIHFELPFPAIWIADILVLVVGIVFLASDLTKRRNFVPYLIVWVVLFLAFSSWEFRYAAPWQTFGKAFAGLLF